MAIGNYRIIDFFIFPAASAQGMAEERLIAGDERDATNLSTSIPVDPAAPPARPATGSGSAGSSQALYDLGSRAGKRPTALGTEPP